MAAAAARGGAYELLGEGDPPDGMMEGRRNFVLTDIENSARPLLGVSAANHAPSPPRVSE
jgi:hypothetical protein